MSEQHERLFELRRAGQEAPRCPDRVRARASALLREQRERSLGARLRALPMDLLPATRGAATTALVRLTSDDLNVDMRIGHTVGGGTRLHLALQPVSEGIVLLLETPPTDDPQRVVLDAHGTAVHDLRAIVRECIVIVQRPGAPDLRSDRVALQRD